jgi:eukaryotic-like serine/threonine-protein kinase
MQLGNYDVVRKLGRGGMADVYLARQHGLDRLVAIKLLDAASDPDARVLFLDEARLCAMLCHPNLAIVYEVAADEGATFIAMEYLDGIDLRQLMVAAHAHGARRLPTSAAVAIVRAAAAGLDHAHQRCGRDGAPLELVHRDVSLSNIMVTRDGAVKVIDFGIARARVSINVEAPGVIRGKPGYMAPEQCMADPIDARCDVFALGVVLYELATGRRCFDGETDIERIRATVRGSYVPASVVVPELPRALERVIDRALAVDPADRYSSAAELVAALDALPCCDAAALGALVTHFRQLATAPRMRAIASDDAPTRGVRHRELRAA